MKFLEQFTLITDIIFGLMILLYLYQIVYIAVSMFKRKVPKLPDAKKNHRYAIFISARNEKGVIGELLDSLHNQTYPKDMYDIYVVADNCTDETAEVARNHEAIVYERFNQEEVGKGYALNFLYHHVIELKGEDYYEAFMVFDADNIIDKNFLYEVNKTFDTGEFDAMTTYRNSKNFDENWLTAAYSIWFMHEARHLNYPRMLLGAQCMISGTGFVVSAKVMKDNNGWPYYLLTEDIQFSVVSTINQLKIGYCDTAILYDEQPSTWKQSWKQRMRWAKGFYQIDGKYLGDLAKGVITAKGRRLAFYDILMTVLPAGLLTIAILGFVLWILASAGLMPYYVRLVFQREMLWFVFKTIGCLWVSLMIIGAITVGMEWDRIETNNWAKVKHLLLFPLFLLSYLPISIQALFTKVHWAPIEHHSTEELNKKNEQ